MFIVGLVGLGVWEPRTRAHAGVAACGFRHIFGSGCRGIAFLGSQNTALHANLILRQRDSLRSRFLFVTRECSNTLRNAPVPQDRLLFPPMLVLQALEKKRAVLHYSTLEQAAGSRASSGSASKQHSANTSRAAMQTSARSLLDTGKYDSSRPSSYQPGKRKGSQRFFPDSSKFRSGGKG